MRRSGIAPWVRAASFAAWLVVSPLGASAEEPAPTQTPAEKPSPPEAVAEAAAERTEEIVFSFGKDLGAAPRRILDDLLGLTAPTNLGILAVSGGLAAVSTQEWDENVRDEVEDDPHRYGRTTNHFLENSGETYNHLAASAAIYATGLFLQSPTFHELGLDALHALTIQIPLTQGLKHAFSTRRPNGGKNGLPSGHVSSTFTLAAVAHENLGLLAGLVGYAWGSAVALHRIDAGHHDLSDTILGAGLGLAVGFASAGNGAPRLAGMEVKPWVDPGRGAKGVGLEYRF